MSIAVRLRVKDAVQVKTFLASGLCVLLLVSTGCRHRTETGDTGSSSVRFIEEPSAPASGSAQVADVPPSGDYFKEAQPIAPLALPAYPPRALAAKAGLAIVTVRVFVDAKGRITDIGPSPLGFSTPGPFAGDFAKAVQAALSQWRFQPAQRYHLEIFRNARGGVDNKESGRMDTETYLDMSFTFTAAGRVVRGTIP